MKWELKLHDGSVVTWGGETGEDAARRYVDTFRKAKVIATRPSERWGVFQYDSRSSRIVDCQRGNR